MYQCVRTGFMRICTVCTASPLALSYAFRAPSKNLMDSNPERAVANDVVVAVVRHSSLRGCRLNLSLTDDHIDSGSVLQEIPHSSSWIATPSVLSLRLSYGRAG